MGGGKQQTTSSTTSNSPQVTALTNKLASQLSSQVDKPSAVYNNPLYTGLSSTTQNGIGALGNPAGAASYGNAIGGSIDELGAIASGQRMGENDSAWNGVKANLANDINSSFNASGRFGGGANASSLANGLASVDLQRIQGNEARQMSAIGALPGAFAASLAPAQAQIAAGSLLDADSLAKRQADYELFNRQQDAPWSNLARASSILSGTAGAAGQTTTNTQPAPNPFQQALGYVLGNAGQAARAFGGGF